jgi:hypothetical protein
MKKEFKLWADPPIVPPPNPPGGETDGTQPPVEIPDED